MGLPVEVFGEIPTYLIESFIRAIQLVTIIGICTAFILVTLTVCTQFYFLEVKFRDLKSEDMKKINDLIKEHKKLLR